MIKKSKQVLVDSVVVFHAHENHYWDYLCSNYRIALPATVVEDELFYFDSGKGKKALNPSYWIEQGKVTRIDADLKSFEAVSKKLSNDFMDSIDPGELEALAILHSKSYQEVFFTTADKAAIKALGVLNMRSRGIAVEELLEGRSGKLVSLPNQFSKKWFQQALAEGFSEQNLWLKLS